MGGLKKRCCKKTVLGGTLIKSCKCSWNFLENYFLGKGKGGGGKKIRLAKQMLLAPFLVPALVERFGVSCMQDFFCKILTL